MNLVLLIYGWVFWHLLPFCVTCTLLCLNSPCLSLSCVCVSSCIHALIIKNFPLIWCCSSCEGLIWDWGRAPLSSILSLESSIHDVIIDVSFQTRDYDFGFTLITRISKSLNFLLVQWSWSGCKNMRIPCIPCAVQLQIACNFWHAFSSFTDKQCWHK
jgi:hypothetical protein